MMYEASAASAPTTSRPAVRLRALAANVHQSCGEEPVLLECGKTCARFQPVAGRVKPIRQSATHATTPMDQSHSGVTRWLRFDNAGSGLGLSDGGDLERQSYSPGSVPGPE